MSDSYFVQYINKCAVEGCGAYHISFGEVEGKPDLTFKTDIITKEGIYIPARYIMKVILSDIQINTSQEV